MSLRQEIYKELADLADRVHEKAKELSEKGHEKDATRAAALSVMLQIWAREWK